MLQDEAYQNLLEKKDATHLVAKVTHGSLLEILFEYECSTYGKKGDIENALTGVVNKVIGNLSASRSESYNEQELSLSWVLNHNNKFFVINMKFSLQFIIEHKD